MLDMLTTWPSPDVDQVWQKRLGAVDDTPEIDVHHPFEVLELGDLDVAHECDARDVVDLVDRSVRIDRGRIRFYRLALGDVEAVGFHGCAHAADQRLGARQPFGVDITDRQLRAPARQLDRQRLPDA